MTFDHACCSFQSGQSITIADLDELEQATNTVLPPDYKAFLLKANGGSLRPFAFEREIPGADFKEKVHSLAYLYEIKEIHRRSQLKMEPALRNIPPGRLAIGSTVSELTITMNLARRAKARWRSGCETPSMCGVRAPTGSSCPWPPPLPISWACSGSCPKPMMCGTGPSTARMATR